MGGHLAEQMLVAVLEGDASVEERAHAEGCAQCQARLLSYAPRRIAKTIT